MPDSNPDDDTRVAPRDLRGSGPAPGLPRGAPKRIGRFELRALLGEGSFGRVYRGYDPELRRDVAIKVPHTGGLDEEFRERFLREARAIAAIHHPNVCPVFEVGTDDDLPFIVMRFVAGTTLGAIIDGLKAPMPPRNAVAIVRKLALGMAAAHAQGVTHRDLKPANVLYDTANREVLITDFGLAHVGGDVNLTAKDSFLGTPAYTSPEQANRQIDKVGPPADVYSLGVILYEMLTGDVPFDGSVMEVAIAHCLTPPAPPSQRRPGLDPKLDEIVLKAMAKTPAQRFRSAREFADVLTDYLRPGDSSASAAGSAPELPSISMSGGREPEPPAAAETVAEKRPERRTAPAYEVVPTPPPVVVEVVEEDEGTAERAKVAKESRRSANRKSAKKSKGKKKARKKDDPLAALRKHAVPIAGGVVALVALVLVVVVVARNRSAPEKAQQQEPEPPAASNPPVVQPAPKAEPKAKSKADPKAMSAEDRLRNRLLGRWRLTAGVVEAAKFKEWEKGEKYYYIEFKSDGTAVVALDSFLPDVRAQMVKSGEARPNSVKFRAVGAEQIEFQDAPTAMQIGPYAKGQRVTVRIDGDNLTLRYADTSARLIRVVLTR